MVYTLKTNRRPVATAREMDVGLDEVGDEGMEWKERGWGGGGRGRIRVHIRERERAGGRERGREGGVVALEQESESCHKTTIIRGLSATQ